MIPPGTWNHLIAVLGDIGSGKSTSAIRIVHELRQVGAYAIAHDPGGNLPERLYDGSPGVATLSGSIDEARRVVASGAPGIHAVQVADGGPVLALALEVAEAARAAGRPTILLLDEIVCVGGATPARLDQELRNTIARRRHLMLAIVWTGQSALFAHYALLNFSTRIVLHKLPPDPREAERLARSGVPRDLVARTSTLGRGEFLTHNR